MQNKVIFSTSFDKKFLLNVRKIKLNFWTRAIKLEIMYGNLVHTMNYSRTRSLVYTYLGSLNVDGVCTNKLSLMFVKTSFWAKKIASLCFISSPLKAVEKAFKAKVEAGICGSQQLMCHVEAMDLRYGATSRPTRDMTVKEKRKYFLANIICYSGSKMSSLWFKPRPCYLSTYFLSSDFSSPIYYWCWH